MAKMTNAELVSAVNNAESDATVFNGIFMQENERLLNVYLGNPYGDEVEGQSQVVSNDVSDVVESDMPSLARVFLGSGSVANFLPNSDDPADIQEAKDKTAYVNWLINEQTESFKTQLAWIKDAEIQKMGVVKYFVEETEGVEEHKFEGINEKEIAATLKSLDGEDVKSVEITDRNEPDDVLDGFNVTFTVVKARTEIKYINVPTENFLITSNSNSIETAELVGDKSIITRGELLEEGVSRADINKLARINTSGTGTSVGRGNEATRVSANMSHIRFQDEGGNAITGIEDWASEKVSIIDVVIKVDYDGDGVAERRKIRKSGDLIISNEVHNHVNYAVMSTILMPHQAIGRSRAEVTESNQRIKTVLLRQMLDNVYLVNNGRNVVSSAVNLDDMLTVRAGGLVRLSNNSTVSPADAVFPLVTPYIGDKALQVIQYLDSTRAQTTGMLLANQGLTVDNLHKETATRFEGINEERKGKIELVARTLAETGYKKLYEGMAWMASKFQDTETEIMVLGKPLLINPSSWKFNHRVRVNVGLGAGDNEQLTQALAGILSIQQQLKERGSLLVDELDIYNTLDRLVKGIGLQDTSEFFNNPEQDDQSLLAQNEMLLNAVESLQQQVQAMANPLAEAEAIAAQKDLIIAEGKAELDIAQFTDDQEKWRAELDAKINEIIGNQSLKATELELDSEKDIPGSRI